MPDSHTDHPLLTDIQWECRAVGKLASEECSTLSNSRCQLSMGHKE